AQGIYLGQASTTSSGIEMTASGDTTIDFSTPGINYKGRIQYNNSTNALSFFTNSSATASLFLTNSTTINKISCNNFEPTIVNTDMIIKANTVLCGDTLTHTSLSDHHQISTQKLSFINICGLRTDSYQDTTAKLDFSLTFTVTKTGNSYIDGNF
ncbi:MAG: hypothetical protein ACKPKO_62030, partial [Candidatus Fonsibacter sp.]